MIAGPIVCFEAEVTGQSSVLAGKRLHFVGYDLVTLRALGPEWSDHWMVR